MKAIIMAGGQGIRLRPLTCNCPKPLIPILGKPTIQYSIELLKSYGVTDIGITLQYLSDDIVEHLGDGEELGVNLRYFIEKSPLGTAGSLKNAEEFLSETFIVLSGDAITDINLDKAIAFHDKNNAAATIVLKEVEYPLDYGVVVTDENNKVIAFQEKPHWNEVLSDKVNTGIYIMNPEVLRFCPKNLKFDISKHLFPILLKNSKVLLGYLTYDYWTDMGKIDEYLRCSKDVLDKNIKLKLNVSEKSEGYFLGSDTTISKTAKITPPVYIGNNCNIECDVEIGPYSIIGDNTVVSKNSSLNRTVVFNDVFIGENSRIKSAIIGRGAKIETGIIIEDNTIIGDETILKTKSIIKRNVKIWPKKIVEENSLIKHHIITCNNYRRNFFYKNKILGKVGIILTSEFMVQLGNAIGAEFKSGDKIAVSCSESSATEMIKFSLFSGLISSGIEVYDLNNVILPVLRESVIFFQFNGAVLIKIKDEDITIELLDKNGINVGRDFQRKIENRVYNEEFRRVQLIEYKKVINISDINQKYMKNILNKLKINNRKLRDFKIILVDDNKQVENIITSISSELGVYCKHIYKTSEELSISSMVTSDKFNLGVIIDSSGEKIILVDEKGHILEETQIDALKAFIISKLYNMKTMVIPINSSPLVEDVAKNLKCKVVKSKLAHKYMLEQYFIYEKGEVATDIKEVFLITIDSIKFLLSLIYYLASREISLSSLISKFNSYYCYKEKIHCPFYLKAKVMRELINEKRAMIIELIEGIKMNFEKGYILITQDGDEPFCSVLAYGSDKDELKELKDKVVNKINTIVNNNLY